MGFYQVECTNSGINVKFGGRYLPDLSLDSAKTYSIVSSVTHWRNSNSAEWKIRISQIGVVWKIILVPKLQVKMTICKNLLKRSKTQFKAQGWEKKWLSNGRMHENDLAAIFTVNTSWFNDTQGAVKSWIDTDKYIAVDMSYSTLFTWRIIFIWR